MTLRIFVKRGAIWRFHRLSRDAQELPVSVEWDRRGEDRRAARTPVADEQRKTDRRGAAPATWDTAEFVVVEERRGRSEPA
jgi:hypothetical protein